ncbi:hypothetical protein HNP46_000278 [Pseudomonas nitritireducens]|uniref:Uncharacterized protein n=1 Tax=Pseudomonas nitroreducens TaxID=46680 RepID=A0A7W7KEN8_PSENT|nr:hypothetical protein [Pseudomonas nitritireducens]MBB4861467.1 hypothetical protein [Pseudomonas nitritireducens]
MDWNQKDVEEMLSAFEGDQRSLEKLKERLGVEAYSFILSYLAQAKKVINMPPEGIQALVQMSPEEYLEEMAKRNLDFNRLAEIFGVKRRRARELQEDANRGRYYDDALLALPVWEEGMTLDDLPPPFTKEGFSGLWKARGWRLQDLGARWGLSKRRIGLMDAEGRPRYLDWAIRNIPVITKIPVPNWKSVPGQKTRAMNLVVVQVKEELPVIFDLPPGTPIVIKGKRENQWFAYVSLGQTVLPASIVPFETQEEASERAARFIESGRHIAVKTLL